MSIVAPKTALEQGLLTLLNLSKGSEAAATSLRYVLRVLTAPAVKKVAGETVPSDEYANGQSRSEANGKHAWREWLQAQTVLSGQGPGRSRLEDIAVHPGNATDSPDRAAAPTYASFKGGCNDLGGYPVMKPLEALENDELDHLGAMHGLGEWMPNEMTAGQGQELLSDPAQMPPFWMPDLLTSDLLGRGSAQSQPWSL
ncbi:hypothetical protein FALBO_10231 [Fusarium albosuccineum]|uniref:Uncharacterized protein n=1 Tax=Fusarium albosuccineum TaxID=1237068 RepID=A0A8H4L6E7_9HYPO|nr:hypothetical protein FALBO_10231 [Fusarium albosuccineum]